MGKMTKSVQANRSKVVKKTVTNFMGGTSYVLNPLDTLKIVAASSIFGEPSYYRNGEFADAGVKKIVDGVFRTNRLVSNHSIFGTDFEGLTTSNIMERAIDAALDYDFASTLQFAVELRKDFYMRLNPQVIMVRASVHPGRKAYTEKNPGKFAEINQLVMSRADEPASQLTYWLFRNGSKSGIPSVLKRSWAKKIEVLSRYQMAKYKNTGIGMIDTIRISHAKGPLVNELMSTGTIEVDDSTATWEKLKSEGKTWEEILNTIKIPHMATLRNLRGIFTEINDASVVSEVLDQLKAGVKEGKQFPFRYYTAHQVISSTSGVNHKPQILDALEECIDLARENMPKLKGKTISLSDNSGSAWGAFNSEYGSVTVADIDNLSSVITGQNADEGYIGVFGDRLDVKPVSKRNGALTQAKEAGKRGFGIGAGTENGIWLFFDNAIRTKEHWDNIFIYSDQQAGHGGLYGTSEESDRYSKLGYGVGGGHNKYIDVMKLIETYRKEVNPRVNVFTVQTAGYDNVLIGENAYRTSVLTGWTGKETVYADYMINFWDEKDSQKASGDPQK